MNERKNSKFGKVLFLRILLITLIPLCFVGVLISFLIRDSFEESFERESFVVYKVISDSIENQLSVFPERLKLILESSEDGSDVAELPDTLFDLFNSLLVLDDTGTVEEIIKAGGSNFPVSDLLGLDLSRQPYFRKDLEHGSIHFTGVFHSIFDNRWSIGTLSRHADGRILLGTFSAEVISELLDSHVGSDPLIFIFDQDGIVAFRSDSDASLRNSLMRKVLSNSKLEDGQNSDFGFTLNGQDYIGYVREIDIEGWKLLVARKLEPYYSRIETLWTFVISGILLSLFFIIVVSVYTARQVNRPLIKLGEISQSIAVGNYTAEKMKSEESTYQEIDKLWQSILKMAQVLEQRQRDLEETTLRMEAVFQQSYEYIGILDLEGRIIKVSDSALDILDTSLGSVIGKYFPDTEWWSHSTRERQKAVDAIESAKRGKTTSTRTFHMNYRNEVMVTQFTVKPCFNSKREIFCFIAEGQDLSDIISTDLRAKEREERYFNLFNSIEDAIYISDESGYVDCNSAGERLLHCPKSRLLELDPMNFSPEFQQSGESSLKLIQKHVDAISAGKTIKRRWRIKRLDGSLCDTFLVAKPFMMDNRQYTMVILHDITEMTALESSLHQSKKLEAIGTLAGGIAHDFNNILYGVMGFVRLAMSEIEKGSEVESYLQQVNQGHKRAEDLVKRILSFSRYSDISEKGSVKLATVIDEVAHLISASLPRNIQLRLKIEDETPCVFGSASEFHQILMNLATNGWHAIGDKQGEIEIGLRQCSSESEGIELLDSTSQPCELWVRDNGSGIPEEVLSKIFDPYFTTKRQGDGTGLGLAMVDGIVRNHNGQIKAETELGKGTTIRVFLPLHIPSTPDETLGHDSLMLKVKPNVLIISGSTGKFAPAKSELEKDFILHEYEEPYEGLKSFFSNPSGFDVLLTSQNMHLLSGMDLVQHIRSKIADFPSIIYSDEAKSMKIADSASNNLIVLKGTVDTAELLSAIKKLLHSRVS